MTIRERDEPVLAVFDMEGTIITSNVVESYVWTRMADLPAEEWPAELASVFGKVPRYLQIDRRDRGDFLRTFFRRYEGASVEGIDRLVANHVGEFMLQKASAAAIRRVRAHRAAGHRTMLDHGGGRAVHPAARAPVRRVDRRRAGGARRAVHRLHVAATARGRSPQRMVEALRSLEGIELKHSYAVRGQLLRPAVAARRRQPGRGGARRRVVPVRAPTPLADRGVGHDQGHAARAVPEAGDAGVND